MARFAPFLIWFILALYSAIDCARTPRERMPGRLNKVAWLAIIILIPLMGAVAWLVVKRAQRAEDAERGWSPGPSKTPQRGRPTRPRRTAGPVAPDDDADFLATLDQQARARRREERQRARDQDKDGLPGGSHSAQGQGEAQPDHPTTEEPNSREEGEDDGEAPRPSDTPPDSRA